MEVTGTNFAKYIESFWPFLIASLQNHAEYQVCAAAVGLVGDLCRTFNQVPLTHPYLPSLSTSPYNPSLSTRPYHPPLTPIDLPYHPSYHHPLSPFVSPSLFTLRITIPYHPLSPYHPIISPYYIFLSPSVVTTPLLSHYPTTTSIKTCRLRRLTHTIHQII